MSPGDRTHPVIAVPSFPTATIHGMSQPKEPHNDERVERGTAMDIALVVAPLVQPAIEAGKVVHGAIKDRPPKKDPPQIVLPPGVDIDE